MVPIMYLTLTPYFFWVSLATRSTMSFWSWYSASVPTSGIMTSGNELFPSFFSSQAASKMAWACISVISGYVDAQAAAAEAQHGVELVHAVHLGLDPLDRHAALLGQVLHVLLGLGQELVQRRVQGADGHGQVPP